jgi:hypothetical protein
MEQPGVAGDWSIKDIVAHITGWRRRTVARVRAASRGEPEPPPYWPAELKTDDEINDWIYASNRDRSLNEVLDDSQQIIRQLLVAIEALPAEALNDPARHLPWLETEAIKPRDFFAHFHDEHEADMRAWLARGDKS